MPGTVLESKEMGVSTCRWLQPVVEAATYITTVQGPESDDRGPQELLSPLGQPSVVVEKGKGPSGPQFGL